MEKGVVLKNYLEGTTTVDTLHFQAEVIFIAFCYYCYYILHLLKLDSAIPFSDFSILMVNVKIMSFSLKIIILSQYIKLNTRRIFIFLVEGVFLFANPAFKTVYYKK